MMIYNCGKMEVGKGVNWILLQAVKHESQAKDKRKNKKFIASVAAYGSYQAGSKQEAAAYEFVA